MDLTAFNTLKLASTTTDFIICDDIAILSLLPLQNRPYYILGGGSNVVLPEKVDGVVLHIKLKGKSLALDNNEAYYVKALAGEIWHDFVLWTLDQGYYGLENLALIPGTIGAAPIQNIGAYGVEVKDYLDHLWAYDLQTGQMQRFTKDECEFGYRESIFKGRYAGRFVITEVVFRLPKVASSKVQYGDIQAELAKLNLSSTPVNIAQAVINIRQRKLPDPAILPNAGSFFKNPLVLIEKAQTLKARFPELPVYPLTNSTSKLAAAWLIEKAGWKGKTLGPVGMYQKQALVLVNHGNASAADIRTLCRAVIADVERLFEVKLEPEPVFWE